MRTSSRISVLAVALMVLAAAPAQADPDLLEIHLSAWPTELSGLQEVNGDSLQGSSTDFANTLGLGSEVLPELSMKVNLPGPVDIMGSYFTSSYAGEETLSENVSFDDVVYSVGEELKSSVDFDIGKLLVSFSVLNFKRLGVGLMVGANLMSMKSQLESAISGEASKDITAPVPTVGVNVRIQPIKKLAIYAEVTGLSANAGGVDASTLDGVVRVEYLINPWIGITGGYRIIDLDVTDDDFGKLDFKQDGAQFGMVIKI